MTKRHKLSLNRPSKVLQEEQPPQSNSVYGKKAWVNAAPQKQAKNEIPKGSKTAAKKNW